MGAVPPSLPVPLLRPRAAFWHCGYCTRANWLRSQTCEGCGAPYTDNPRADYMRAYYNNLSVPHAIITLPQLREPLTPTDAPEAAKQIIVAVLLVAVLTMGAVVLHVAGLL